MARHTTKGWNYSTGERGRNRVRVFEHSSGILMLEFRKNGKRTRTSLGHRDRDRAKREADQAAARLAEVEEGLFEPEHQEEPPEELTLQKLFEIYGEEVTPEKGERTRKHDKAASKMFERYFGADRVPATLNLLDWERFIRDRQAGRIGPGEPPWKPVSARTVERDLRFLLAVMNWATMAGDGQGGVLLERNPLKGYKAPKEKNPLRVKLSDEEYKALLAVAKGVDWRFYVALVLAHETGHRIGAVRQLRWSDIDLEGQSIRWRAETEKTGYAHVTPMTEEALEAFQFARSMNPSIGDAPVMPSPEKPTECMSRYLARDWWKRAEKEAELERKRGRGWHSLRRKFASDLKEIPLKTLQQLGGWKTHMTILMCYQQVDEGEMREALQRRRTGT
jgi:integrase